MKVMKAWTTIVLSLILCSPISANSQTLLILGDSLSAAFGMERQQGWGALLQDRLLQQNRNHKVINASISGETTSGGLSRLPALLHRYQPGIVIIALGANDGLRGLSLEQMQANLSNMAELSKREDATVLMVGIQLPPNYGPVYTQKFRDIFKQVSASQSVALIPSLLDGIGKDKSMFQQDGLHPTAKAQSRILNNIWPTLEPLL